MNHIISGIALINGLKLAGGGIISTAKRQANGQIQIKIKRQSKKIRKLQLALLLLLFCLSMIPDTSNPPDAVVHALVIPLIVFMVGLRYIPNLRLLNYHGAEHKVVVAYRNKQALTLESVRPLSRVTNVCGTMLVAPISFYMLLLSLLVLLTDNIVIHVLLTFMALISIGHYFFLRGEDTAYVNMRRLFPFLKRFLKKKSYRLKTNALYRTFDHIGYFLQAYFTTREPSDEELKVAILCMQRLIDSHRH